MNKIRIAFRFILPITIFAIVVSCEESFKPLNEVVREPDATIRFFNFKRSANKPDGKLEWKLNSEEAYMFEKDKKQSKIVVYNFTFISFDDKEPTTIVAERGEINYDKQLMYVSGQVHFKEGNTRTIESSALEYNLETKIL